MAIILPAGTKITCETGHYICTTVHEMVASEKRPAVRVEYFGHWAEGQPIPKPGDRADKCICAKCGAPWIDERPGILYKDGEPVVIANVAQLHTESGWWPDYHGRGFGDPEA